MMATELRQLIWRGSRLAVLAGIALVSACSQDAPPGLHLTGEQFRAAIAGQRLFWESGDRTHLLTARGGYAADGTLATDWEIQGKLGHYSGTWELDGDRVCVTDSPADGGERTCRTWRKLNDTEYAEVNPDGTLHGIAVVLR